MRQRTKVTISLIVSAAIFSVVFAVAASLDVTAGTLGAGTSAVTSCDGNGVSTTYSTSFSASLADYQVTTVSVAGVATPACDGRTMKVTLLDDSDVALAEITVTLGTPAADPTDLDFSADDVAAGDVHKVAVVIYG